MAGRFLRIGESEAEPQSNEEKRVSRKDAKIRAKAAKTPYKERLNSSGLDSPKSLEVLLRPPMRSRSIFFFRVSLSPLEVSSSLRRASRLREKRFSLSLRLEIVLQLSMTAMRRPVRR